jgi:hypothetical protein
MVPYDYRRVVLAATGLAGTGACFIIFCLALLSGPIGQERLQLWDGYYTLLVDERVAESEVLERLGEKDIRTVLSSRTARVSFHSFEGMEEVSVSALDSRFDPRDPRLDPYMESLPRFFTAEAPSGSSAVYYLMAEEGPVATYLRIASALAGVQGEWQLVGWDWLGGALALALFALMAAAAVVVSREGKVWLALGAVPWLPVTLIGGMPYLAPATLLYLAWCYAMEGLIPSLREFVQYRRITVDRRELIWRVGMLFAVIIVVSLFRGIDDGLGAVWSPLAADLAVIAMLLTGYHFRRTVHEHRVFLPSRILRRNPFRRRSVSTVYLPLLPWLGLVLIAAPLAYGQLIDTRGPSLPQPQPIRHADDFSYDSLRRVWEWGHEGSMPTFARYVAHRAYQEAYLYDPTFALPKPGETVTLSRFSAEGERMTKRREVVVRYDEGWLDRVQRGASAGTVAGVLAAEGKPTGVVHRAVRQIYWQPLQRLRQISLVVTVLAPMFVIHSAMVRTARAAASSYGMRRKKQAA